MPTNGAGANSQSAGGETNFTPRPSTLASTCLSRALRKQSHAQRSTPGRPSTSLTPSCPATPQPASSTDSSAVVRLHNRQRVPAPPATDCGARPEWPEGSAAGGAVRPVARAGLVATDRYDRAGERGTLGAQAFDRGPDLSPRSQLSDLSITVRPCPVQRISPP